MVDLLLAPIQNSWNIWKADASSVIIPFYESVVFFILIFKKPHRLNKIATAFNIRNNTSNSIFRTLCVESNDTAHVDKLHAT